MFTIMNKKTMPQENIEYVQTCIRHKTGIGDAIDIDFKAPIDTSSKEASLGEIKYNWRQAGDEALLLHRGKFKDFAYIQLLKMCHFLQKVRNIEILKMQA